jgi:EpsI family protein
MGLFPSLQEEGFWHNFSGWLIFIGCFGFLVLLNRLLDYWRPNVRHSEGQELAPESPIASTMSGKSLSLYLISALALVILVSPVPLRLAQVPEMPLLQTFDRFPLKLGPWQGQREYVDAQTLGVLGTKDYFDATFIGLENKPVFLWIAYYGNMKKRGGLLHSPLVCMTGGGWDIKESMELDMLPGRPVNYLLMEQGDQRVVVYYWYIQRGRWLPNEYYNKLYLGLDSLFKHRADGALIRLTTPVENDVESAKKRLNEYAQMLVPILPKFIPN